jgi:hypothetical protein
MQITIRQILDFKITEKPTLEWKVRQLQLAKELHTKQSLSETV